jgi:hypothetical protein
LIVDRAVIDLTPIDLDIVGRKGIDIVLIIFGIIDWTTMNLNLVNVEGSVIG